MSRRTRYLMEYHPDKNVFFLFDARLAGIVDWAVNPSDAFEWLRLPGVKCVGAAAELFDPPAEEVA